MYIVNVAPLSRIPPPSSQVLSYFTSKKLERGSLVLIPLRKKRVRAIVFSQERVEEAKIEIKKALFQLKPILKVVEKNPVLSMAQTELATWISEYYFTPLGKTLSLFLSRLQLKKKRNRFLSNNFLGEKKEIRHCDIQNHEKPLENEGPRIKKLCLAPLGVLPEEAKKTIEKSKEVLFLVPEKKKEKFWQEKLKDLRLNVASAEEGTRLDPAKRACLDSAATRVENRKIVIGTRSELFGFFSKLDLIVLTEEESLNYKSEREPRYNAKKVSEMLAKIFGAKMILISSFPSVETYSSFQNSLQISPELIKTEQKYSSMGKIIIDMKSIKKWQPISPQLYEAIKKNLPSLNKDDNTSTVTREKLHEQSSQRKTLLFLNRKGEATTLICQDCGWIKKCKNCDVPMVCHSNAKNEGKKMVCHHCGFRDLIPERCENCQSWRLTTLGIGIEKVEKELKNNFPRAKILRLDSETAPKESEQSKILKDFFEGETDILMATSLLFKHLPLPKVDLVGIISLDAQFSLPDFRSEEEGAKIIEKLFSLSPKTILVQTYFPESIGIKWIEKGKDFFFKNVLEERKNFSYPPFSSLIKLTFSHRNPEKAEKEAYRLKKEILTNSHSLLPFLQVLGPAPTFIPKIKGNYIWQILIKLKVKNLKLKVDLLSVVPPSWKIDVDPARIL